LISFVRQAGEGKVAKEMSFAAILFTKNQAKIDA
jgi:hypothetical protein